MQSCTRIPKDAMDRELLLVLQQASSVAKFQWQIGI